MMNSFGIAHRDLKSFLFFVFLIIFLFENFEVNKFRSNILLEKENGKLNAVICDFGLARVQETKVNFLSSFFLSFFYFQKEFLKFFCRFKHKK